MRSRKTRKKNCARSVAIFICANDISRMDTGFDANENELTLFFRDGSQRHLSRASKLKLARTIVKNLHRVCRKALTNRPAFISQEQ